MRRRFFFVGRSPIFMPLIRVGVRVRVRVRFRVRARFRVS